MKAEDTVIKEGAVIKNQMVVFQDHKLMEAQAEISFKAGRESMLVDIPAAIAQARKNGIKEVVEWMIKPCPHTTSASYFKPKCICYVCKQAKLKEWGIDAT